MSMPEWLKELHLPPGSVPAPGPAHRNDFAIVSGTVDGQTVQRVVFVTEEYDTHLSVMLCHSYKEMATDYDVIVPHEQSHTPYDLVIGTDLYGVVFQDQVIGVVGSVSDDVREAARHSLATDGESLDALIGPRGLPLAGIADPRRKFKEDELDELAVLRQRATWFLLGDR